MHPDPRTVDDVDKTQWSTILAARDGEESIRHAAMNRLLTRYYQPIYRHIESSLLSNRTPENIQDLTHGFIESCIETRFLKNVDPKQGRFRNFIRQCINNYLIQQHRRRTALKRDVRKEAFSLNAEPEADEGLMEPVAYTIPPDTTMDREWALTLLSRAMDALAKECRASERTKLFEVLKPHLHGQEEEGSYKSAAERLKIPEARIRIAVHRLRKRLGELISEEVKRTIGTEEDWREELRYLMELMV